MTAADAPAASIPSLWLRLAARLFDELLFLVVRLPLTLAFVRAGGPDGLLYEPPRWALAVAALVPFVYDLVSVAWRGATPGKALFRLRVVNVVDGGRVPLDRAALRAVVPVVGSALALAVPETELAALLALVTPLVDASVGWNAARRGWHDLAAGTLVVRREPLG